MTTLFPLALAGASAQDPTGTGWMAVASFIVPAVLLAVLLYIGARNTV